MLQKEKVVEILERFLETDFSKTYPHHFYKKIAYENDIEIATVKAICEGFSHKDTYYEVVRDTTSDFLTTFKEFADSRDRFLINEWNEFSAVDFAKICMLLRTDIRELFYAYKKAKK